MKVYSVPGTEEPSSFTCYPKRYTCESQQLSSTFPWNILEWSFQLPQILCRISKVYNRHAEKWLQPASHWSSSGHSKSLVRAQGILGNLVPKPAIFKQYFWWEPLMWYQAIPGPGPSISPNFWWDFRPSAQVPEPPSPGLLNPGFSFCPAFLSHIPASGLLSGLDSGLSHFWCCHPNLT